MTQEQIERPESFTDQVKKQVIEMAHTEWLQSLHDKGGFVCGPNQNKTINGLTAKQYAMPYKLIEEIIDDTNSIKTNKKNFKERYNELYRELVENLMVPLVDNFDEVSDEDFNNWMNRVAANAPKLNEAWAKVSGVIIDQLGINNANHNIEAAVDALIRLKEQCKFISGFRGSSTKIIKFIIGMEPKSDTTLLKQMMIAAHHFWRQAYFGINKELDIEKAGIFDQTEINSENIYFKNQEVIDKIYDKNGNLKPDFNAQEFINNFAADKTISSIESFARMLRLGQLLSDQGVTDAIALDANIKVVEIIIENYEGYLRSIGKNDLADKLSEGINDFAGNLEDF